MANIILLSGLSGAGITTAADVFEDLGYKVMEHLPISIVKDVIDQVEQIDDANSKIVVSADLKTDQDIDLLFTLRSQLREKFNSQSDSVDVLFIYADDETIIRRFDQTRRPHPYISGGVLTKGIVKEREFLNAVLEDCDVQIDTTSTNPTQLAAKLQIYFGEKINTTKIIITSFGFKYGAPRDSNFVYDVRFLPNPYWEPSLKKFNGMDELIQEYVSDFSDFDNYIDATYKSLKIAVDEFKKLQKGYVAISFGCTGGQHRSVAVAEKIQKMFSEDGFNVVTIHRELELN
jgi:UPF0042 nucleotide-binding protein